MGDRGNIEIDQGDGTDSLYLYTHWQGSQICQTLAEGLHASKGRWHDPAYTTRVVFNALQGEDRGITGFGISVGYPPDNEHEIPKVSWVLEPIRLGNGAPAPSGAQRHGIRVSYKGVESTAEQFIAYWAPELVLQDEVSLEEAF
jgi:hypothetical protein